MFLYHVGKYHTPSNPRIFYTHSRATSQFNIGWICIEEYTEKQPPQNRIAWYAITDDYGVLVPAPKNQFNYSMRGYNSEV
jgi:hypothetical protein